MFPCNVIGVAGIAGQLSLYYWTVWSDQSLMPVNAGLVFCKEGDPSTVMELQLLCLWPIWFVNCANITQVFKLIAYIFLPNDSLKFGSNSGFNHLTKGKYVQHHRCTLSGMLTIFLVVFVPRTVFRTVFFCVFFLPDCWVERCEFMELLALLWSPWKGCVCLCWPLYNCPALTRACQLYTHAHTQRFEMHNLIASHLPSIALAVMTISNPVTG